MGVGGYLNCSNKPQWITVQVGQGFGVELSGSDTRTKAQVQVLEPGTAGFFCNLNARGRGLGSTTGYKQDPREYILTIYTPYNDKVLCRWVGLDTFWTSACVCVVAGWERGAKTVLETGEKVKIPWGQQGPGGNKISGKFLRVDEDFF